VPLELLLRDDPLDPELPPELPDPLELPDPVEYFVEVVVDPSWRTSVPKSVHSSQTSNSAPSTFTVLGEDVSAPHISHWTMPDRWQRPPINRTPAARGSRPVGPVVAPAGGPSGLAVGLCFLVAPVAGLGAAPAVAARAPGVVALLGGGQRPLFRRPVL